ncbi:MAG: hypothetical protein GC152_02370 [Alphaproteobacteria bacterium]|nr:hypothetical protein [Alphaproteobacteria bacterium]
MSHEIVRGALAPWPPDGADTALGGAYGWLTPHVAAIAGVNPDFARRALVLERSELHFIALAISLMEPSGLERREVEALGRRIGVAPRDAVLAAAAPAGTRGMASVVGRLVGKVWRPPTYRRLAALMANAETAKAIRHMKNVSRRDIRTMTRLPDGYRTRPVIELLRRRGHVPTVVFAIDLVRRVRRDLTDRQIMESLKSMQPGNPPEWIERHYAAAPFPPPPAPGVLPVAGGGKLTPLMRYGELVQAGEALRNCARTYAMAVIRGDSYIYAYTVHRGHAHWPGGMVEVRRAPLAGWCAVQALGQSNEPLAPAARFALAAALKSAGYLVAPRLVHPDAPWLNIDFD